MMLCVNVLSKTSFLSLFSNKKAAQKTTETAPHKKKRKIFRSTKEQQTETEREREREREREKERGAQTSGRDRERERRDDKTRRRKGTETLFFPRFSIRFLDFFFFVVMKNIISSSFHRSLHVVSK